MVTTGNMINHELVKLFEVNFPTIKNLFESGSNVIEINQNVITVHE